MAKSVQMPRMKNPNPHEILVQTKVNYLADQSDEEAHRYVFEEFDAPVHEFVLSVPRVLH